MADIAKKTVSIYIDQASAELALEKLQQKADAFSKKTEEARQRQQQLNAEIKKAEAAAAGLTTLRANYAELEKGISKTARSLDITTASQKKLAAENKSLSATLEAATSKAAALQAEIDKAKTAGDATKRLENNYDALSHTIQETTDRLRTNEAAIAAAATKHQALAAQLQQQKTTAAALNAEVRESAKAASSVTRLTAEYNKLDKQLATNEQVLEKNLAAQKAIQSQVDAGMRPSFNQLKNLVHQLDKELQNLSEDVPGYASKFAAFRSASAQLEEMETRLRGVKKESQSLLSQFKGVAFGVAAGGLVQGAIQAIPQTINNIIDGGAKLSDEMSDVEKATNLTEEQVKKLNSQFKKIDTRTPVAELRNIAIGLGQVGEAASKDNVAAIDTTVVALGDEFGGGAKQITTELSVLRNNLQDIKTGDYAQDILHIANALNVAGATGLATAPVVTDIANRIAGVSQQFKISSGNILGYAATFQETGIEVERGSTAIVKLFQNIAAEPEKFAKAIGLSGPAVTDFINLVNTDMSAAFQKVAKGVQQAGKDNVSFSKILKELDADGSGAGEVLSKLAQNSDLLSTKQKQLSAALQNTSSITEEFGKKNNNAAAEIEKFKKSFNSFFGGIVSGAVDGVVRLIRFLKELPQTLNENRTAIIATTGVLLAYVVTKTKAAQASIANRLGILLETAADKLQAAQSIISTTVARAYGFAKAVLTREITLATAAQRIYNVVLKANPIALVISLVAALATAVSFLAKRITEQSAAQKLQNEIQRRAVDSYADEEAKLRSLAQVVGNSTVSLDARKKALQELIAINPQYLGGLTLENIKTQQGTDIINNYVKALRQKALAQAATDVQADKIKEDIRLQQIEYSVEKKIGTGKTDLDDLTDEEKEFVGNTRKRFAFSASLSDLATGGSAAQEALDAIKLARSKITNEMDITTDIITKNYQQAVETAGNTAADVATQGGQKAVRTIATIEAEIKKLDDDLKTIDVREGKALQANREARKKLQQELNNAEGKKDPSEALHERQLKSQQAAAAKQQRLDDKETADRLKRQRERLEFDGEYLGRIKQLYDERLGQFPELAERLGKFEDTEFNNQLVKIKRFYDEKRRLFIGDKDAQADLDAAEKTEVTTIINKAQTSGTAKAVDQVNASIDRARAYDQAELIAKDQLQVFESTGKKKLEAQIKLIEDDRFLQLQNTQLTETQRQLLIAESEKAISDLKLQFEMARLQMVLDFAQQAAGVLNSLAEVASNNEDAALKKDKRASDEKRKNLERLLKSKAISQAEYNRKIADLDAEDDARQEAVKKKQFERGKKLQLLQVAIATAQAIVSTLAAPPGAVDILTLGAFRAIQIGIAVATGAAQAAAISSKKYAKGGISEGPSHAEGGIAMIDRRTGQEVGEMEGQEGILSKKTLRNNWDLVGPLLHASMYQDGARVQLPWQSRSYQGINYSSLGNALRVVKKYETGGIAPSVESSSATAANTETQQQNNAVNLAILDSLEALRRQMATPQRNYVVLNDINTTQAQIDRIVSTATASR